MVVCKVRTSIDHPFSLFTLKQWNCAVPDVLVARSKSNELLTVVFPWLTDVEYSDEILDIWFFAADS